MAKERFVHFSPQQKILFSPFVRNKKIRGGASWNFNDIRGEATQCVFFAIRDESDAPANTVFEKIFSLQRRGARGILFSFVIVMLLSSDRISRRTLRQQLPTPIIAQIGIKSYNF
jgi:hypothetical protein